MQLFATLLALPFAASTNAGLPAVDGRSSDDLLALLTDMHAKIRTLEIGAANQIEEIAKLKAVGTNGVQRGLMSRNPVFGLESPPGNSNHEECASAISYEFLGSNITADDLIVFFDYYQGDDYYYMDEEEPSCAIRIKYINDDTRAFKCISNCANTNFNGLGEIDGPYASEISAEGCKSNCGNMKSESKIDLSDESQSQDLADLIKSIAISAIGYNPTCENQNGRKACQKTEGCEWALNACSPLETHPAGAASKIDGSTKEMASASIKISAWGWLVVLWAPIVLILV